MGIRSMTCKFTVQEQKVCSFHGISTLWKHRLPIFISSSIAQLHLPGVFTWLFAHVRTCGSEHAPHVYARHHGEHMRVSIPAQPCCIAASLVTMKMSQTHTHTHAHTHKCTHTHKHTHAHTHTHKFLSAMTGGPGQGAQGACAAPRHGTCPQFCSMIWV